MRENVFVLFIVVEVRSGSWIKLGLMELLVFLLLFLYRERVMYEVICRLFEDLRGYQEGFEEV